MKRMKFLSLLLTLAIMLTVQTPVCAAGPSAIVTAGETEISEQNGALEIYIEATEEILGGSFNLIYDPTVVQFNGFYAESYTCQVNQAYETNKIRVSFAGQKGITSGVLLIFYFTPIVNDSCTTSFSFENVSLYNVQGKNVDATATGAVCDVKVLKPMNSLTLSATDVTLGVGEKMQMSYRLTPEDATIERVTWKSFNTSVADVDENGLITAKREGYAYMECTVTDCFYNTRIAELYVNVYKKPNVIAGSGYLTVGQSITVAVRLDTVGNQYSSGSMNLIYDPEVLSLTSATIGNLLTNCTATINPNYRDDTVRLNFLSQHGIEGSGEICLLTFTALKAGEVKITADKVLLYTANGKEHNANIGKGTVGVGEYALSLSQPTDVQAWREFSTEVSFVAEPGVAGGSFIVEYNATALRFLGYSNVASGFTVSVNDTFEQGKIKISFAGTQGVAEASLLTLRFVSFENPEGGFATEVDFVEDSAKLYTQSGTQVIPNAVGASFTVAENQTHPGMGDVDSNEEIDTRDATTLLQYLLGDSDAIETEMFADLNGDGSITDADMDYLMKILAGWTPEQIFGQ